MMGIKMNGLKCVICDSGDIRKGIVCTNCICRLEEREKMYYDMVQLVTDSNYINGSVSPQIKQKIHEKVLPVYELLCEIKIEDECD